MPILCFASWLPNSEERLQGISQLALVQVVGGPALGLVQLDEQCLQLFLHVRKQNLLTSSRDARCVRLITLVVKVT